MRKIEIYTDGSCLGNPGPGGWGVIVLNGGQQKPASGGHSQDHAHDSLSGGEAQTTNNRMEMTAIIKALEWVHKNLGGKPTHTTAKPTESLKKTATTEFSKEKHNTRITSSDLNNYQITIYSDSNLIVQTLNQGWKRKANTDLWAKIDKLRAWLNISFVWVKAHHTNGYNNQVDKLAFDAARKFKKL